MKKEYRKVNFNVSSELFVWFELVNKSGSNITSRLLFLIRNDIVRLNKVKEIQEIV
jgi:hypothetical protein